MSSLLFIIAIDWVMRTTITEGNTRLTWTLCTTLEDTDYADDLALLSDTEDHMQEKTRKLEENGWPKDQCQENKVNIPKHREICQSYL